jgi:hypothetical protein
VGYLSILKVTAFQESKTSLLKNSDNFLMIQAYFYLR